MSGPLFQPPPFVPGYPPINMAVHDLIPPYELYQAISDPYDTLVDRDLAKLIEKANNYGGAIPDGHVSRHKYAKYVFLAGLLLTTRGLPPNAVRDDPNDPYVKIMNVYLSNPQRMGNNPDVLLANILAGRRSRRHRHHHHHHHHRHHRHHSSRSRSQGNGSDHSSRRRSSSRGAGSQKSRSRGGSHGSRRGSTSSSDYSDDLDA